MRDRLINLLDEAVHGQAAQTLNEVADYLIDNGVIVPPCNIDDELFKIDHVYRRQPEIVSDIIKAIRATKREQSVQIEVLTPRWSWVNIKGFFTSIEEAEAKLVEMQCYRYPQVAFHCGRCCEETKCSNMGCHYRRRVGSKGNNNV